MHEAQAVNVVLACGDWSQRDIIEHIIKTNAGLVLIPGNIAPCALRRFNRHITSESKTSLFRTLTSELNWKVLYSLHSNPSLYYTLLSPSPGIGTRAPFVKGVEHVANTWVLGWYLSHPSSTTYSMPNSCISFFSTTPSASQSPQCLFTFHIQKFLQSEHLQRELMILLWGSANKLLMSVYPKKTDFVFSQWSISLKDWKYWSRLHWLQQIHLCSMDKKLWKSTTLKEKSTKSIFLQLSPICISSWVMCTQKKRVVLSAFTFCVFV